MEELVRKMRESHTITVLTGAGVSTESGIPDFRSPDGVWQQNDKNPIHMTSGYFNSRPKLFWPRYKEIFNIEAMSKCKPTTVHMFLRQLEEEGRDIRIFTQNIDGLHNKAGSSRVFEMHGSMNSATCPKCKTQYGLAHILKETIPRCIKEKNKGNTVCGFILKPDTVLFGDRVRHYEEAVNSINQSSLFVVLGSSLQVMPVNQLPVLASQQTQITTGIINKEPTGMDRYFDNVLHGSVENYLKMN